MKRIATLTIMILTLALWSGTAAADCGKCGKGEKAHAEQMGEKGKEMHAMHHEMMEKMAHQKLVEHYATMAKTLSNDSTEGISAHAEAMAAALTPGEKKEPIMAASSLATLQKENLDLKQARTAFGELSAEIIPALKAHYPHQDAEAATVWAVYHCDMAPGSWVQAEGKAYNPYYGSKMLHCGQKVVVLGEAEKGMEEKNKEKGHKHES